MSQWNNSYAYNNQYQGSNAWNGDVNAQFMNETYYQGAQYDPSNQYVSFNEFLSQMQSNNSTAAPAAANYNNVQYQNYPNNQFNNYQNLPSSSQNSETYNYASNSSVNDKEIYQAQNQYNVAPDQSAINEVVFKSNLTPTATEFVPKSSVKSSSSSQHVKPESSKGRSSVKESKSSHGSSSDTNWRERPGSSSQNGSSRQEHNKYDNKQDSNYKDSNNHNKENSHRHESNYRDSNNRNYDRNAESRNYESNNRDSRYESRNYDNCRNHDNSHNWSQKSGPKGKNKDSERTFYNSSINKTNQDVRNGRESSGRSRNYAGSSRLRASDRNITEDEQYASNYLQYKDRGERDRDRSERDRDRNERDRDRGERDRDREEKVEKEKPPQESKKEDKKMTQRERLTDQLNKGTLECLVCCERVRQTERVWSCSNCYHVLHLRCIKKWATSSLVEGKWRCPACQNMSSEIPAEYWCMCGAVRSPEHVRGVAAHCCGRQCQRPRACPHACPYQCHPGPCPPCNASITKQCGCGAESQAVVCSSKTPLLCGRICNRLLPCGLHKCAKECHEGACGDCPETITQVCYCELGKKRSVPCSGQTATGEGAVWSCGSGCTFVLPCGVHGCGARCHPPPCAPCPLRPDNVPTCPCGHTRILPGTRTACTDPIPLCDNICAKPLSCGPPGDKHFCKLNCHQGDCPPCPDKTVVACRCGHSSREVPCADLDLMINNVFCQKKCNKKLSCGRHRCRLVCCAEQSHRCGVVCGRTLSCQLHRCEEFCHTGHCAPCPQLSFEELSCECGASVLLPPVRCGVRPPACAAQCPRRRPCGHAPHHTCHSGDCPPCVVLTAKMCHGNHEERKTIPCSLEEFSCGLPCGKPLPCGKHTCIKICHKGPCDTGKCIQPCNEKRPSCGHPCAAPCHADNGGACPSAAPCKRTVRAECQCGRRKQDRACADNSRDRARIMSALAATKMQEGGSVEISDMRPGSMLKTLECDDECRVEARTRQLALALQIRNPDVSAKLAPRYSDHIRATAAKEPSFAQLVHDKLTELVQLAKKSKQKTRSHSFPSMNWQKRQFIHELCEHFGCESVAYDAEPNRNVVATADKEKSWLPAMSILEVLAREAGKRRVPGPVLRAPHGSGAAPQPASSANKSSTGWATLTSTNAWAARSQAKAASSSTSVTAPSAAPAAPKIDYFDNPPE